ncbi:MAG: hypothetical protein JRH18_10915, partial [Deltaproteobacteria bacterium]|nr:hypothetical protein [Deltaproteobacteria bacterium]
YPEVKCIGGGSKNRFWIQLKADVTERKMIIDKIQEHTSLGAAILAGIGTGIYRNVDEAFEVTKREEELIYPRAENSEVYKRLYDTLYRDLYGRLIGINQDIEKVFKPESYTKINEKSG